MTSSPIITCSKDLTGIKYGNIITWSLYEDLRVVYESHCPEKSIYHKQEMDFDNLPVQIKIMIAKQAVKSPQLKIFESTTQLKLVLFAVKKSTINLWL